MIRPTPYCDQCGRAKQEGNHWFRAVVIPRKLFLLVPWEIVFTDQSLDDLAESCPDLNEHMEDKHLCSESCAVKAMSKAIGQQGTDG